MMQDLRFEVLFFFQHVQLVYPFVKHYVMMQDLRFEVLFFFQHVQLVYPFVKRYVMMQDLWGFFQTRPACLPLHQALCDDARLMF